MKKICTFTGHGKIIYGNEIYTVLTDHIERLICDEEICEFWVGNYGNFDAMAANAVKALREIYPIKLCLVVPYITHTMHQNNAYYNKTFDEIIVCDVPPDTPKRAYIPLCNKYMADMASVLLCYVKYNTGGAFQTFKYAKEKNIKIINLAY